MNPYRAALQATRLNFAATKQGFIEYVKFKKYHPRVQRTMVSFLTRYVPGNVSDAKSVMRIFSGLTDGQAHNLNRAFRAWLNYLQIMEGADKARVTELKAAMPKDATFIDLNVPDEAQILRDFKVLPTIPVEHQAIYNLLLDSGLRLVEGMRILNEFTEPEAVNGFYRATVGMFRGCKQSYYCYYTQHTYNLLKQARETRTQQAVEKFFQNHDITRAKYLRKFCFDSMIGLEVPESVADFIEGRVPKRVGAKHYCALRRQADKFYGKYAVYLTKLREGKAREQ